MKILFHEEADQEFVAAIEWYEERDPGLGIAFYEAVRGDLERILKEPQLWPVKIAGTRRFLMRRFPFAIHYLVLHDDLWVVAVAHTARRPYYWRERMEE